MNTQRPGISIVVPVFNSAEILPELVSELARVVPDLAEEFELVLVDDGSSDHSPEVMQRLAAEHDWVTSIFLVRNFGQHNALLCGIRQAKHEITVTMDDDMQHPPTAIGKLLERLDQGYDVVYGPPIEEQHSLFRDLASIVTKLALQSAMGAKTARQSSAFRAFRTEIRHAFQDYQSPYVSIDVLLTWGTSRFSAVPVRHEPRRSGASNYTVRKLINHAVNMMTGFSTLPLRLASVVGFSTMLFGIGILVYVLIRKLFFGINVPGFAFLAVAVSVFAGAQLFAIGVIGEYLARMHFRLMDRPPYVVKPRLEATRH